MKGIQGGEIINLNVKNVATILAHCLLQQDNLLKHKFLSFFFLEKRRVFLFQKN